jgi:prevent-host-death family protein
MEKASITEAKNNLSALIDRVRAGASILLLDNGQPVARLEPVGTVSSERDDGHLLRLVRAGIVRPGRTEPPRSLFRDNPPRAQSATSTVELLLQERRDGR